MSTSAARSASVMALTATTEPRPKLVSPSQPWANSCAALPSSSASVQLENSNPPGMHHSPVRAGLAMLCDRHPALRHPDAVIVGPESRSSCPVRIVRDRDSLQSPSFAGLYPMGEGAGYAGGIVSAAIDGMRCAEAFLAR